MTKQLNYAMTSRYNFPQSVEALHLPKKFVELSLRSMKEIRGKLFRPNETLLSSTEIENNEDSAIVIKDHRSFAEAIPLEPLQVETKIVAIDVSSIKIGETETGLICAIRGAIVWKEKSQYEYLRLGPFPFQITEENRKELYNLFRRHYLKISKKASPPTLANMQTRMGSLLERWLQTEVTHSSFDSIILWDGSLTAGSVDSPVKFMSQLLEKNRNQLNTVLAFSKTSKLRLLGRRLTDSFGKSHPPFLIRINDFPSPSGPLFSLGDIYVAKLTNGVCSFRLDIDKKLSQEKGIEAVKKLLRNDLIVQSYPETLRLAHIFSTFTANEVIGIQRFIAREYGLNIVERPNIRRLLFGPFGKGPEG